jgi:ubiquinone/menaquinone biosynthesis C-methylase UbiE
MLGYDAAELSLIPATVTSSFAGVANPHAIAPLPVGATVVDIGCGAGMDLLLAARHVGPSGRAIGIDMTEAMRNRANEGAMRSGLKHVEVRSGDATSLPVDNASVDVIISNGVLNLVPEKERAIAEMVRILKPGGRIQIGDITIGTELDDEALADIDLWTG